MSFPARLQNSRAKVSRWEHRRTARNRNLGTISLPQITESVSRCDARRRDDDSAAELVDDPKNQTEEHADDQARDQREVESTVLTSMDEVAGEASEAERQSAAKIQECADGEENHTKDQHGAAELLNRFHRAIVEREKEGSNQVTK
jgi:hypothetical protein